MATVAPHHQQQQQPQPQQQHGGRKPVLTVIAPGAGLKANKQVFDQLQHPGSGWDVKVEGQSKAAYDVYPPPWQNGRPGANLQTFGEEVARKGVPGKSDCLLFGSRGGQVVLPVLWRAHGDALPPAVVINGGCAMSLLPTEGWQHWPAGTVTLLLMGGEDFFRGGLSPEQHLQDAMACVPRANGTTAILYVDQMRHMPQNELLQPVLPRLLHAALAWEASCKPPAESFDELLSVVRRGGFSGRFVHKAAPGDSWEEVVFNRGAQTNSQRSVSPKAPLPAALQRPATASEAQEQRPRMDSAAARLGVTPRMLATEKKPRTAVSFGLGSAQPPPRTTGAASASCGAGPTDTRASATFNQATMQPDAMVASASCPGDVGARSTFRKSTTQPAAMQDLGTLATASPQDHLAPPGGVHTFGSAGGNMNIPVGAQPAVLTSTTKPGVLSLPAGAIPKRIIEGFTMPGASLTTAHSWSTTAYGGSIQGYTTPFAASSTPGAALGTVFPHARTAPSTPMATPRAAAVSSCLLSPSPSSGAPSPSPHSGAGLSSPYPALLRSTTPLPAKTQAPLTSHTSQHAASAAAPPPMMLSGRSRMVRFVSN